MKVQKFKNGGLQTVYTEPSEIADFVKLNIESILDYWIHKSQRLEEENRLLKDNEFVQKVEEENAKLREELNTAFVISSANREKNKKWIDEHLKQKHPDRKWLEYHYKFYPTPVGVFGSCVCDYCKERNDLGEV